MCVCVLGVCVCVRVSIYVCVYIILGIYVSQNTLLYNHVYTGMQKVDKLLVHVYMFIAVCSIDKTSRYEML